MRELELENGKTVSIDEKSFQWMQNENFLEEFQKRSDEKFKKYMEQKEMLFISYYF